MKKVSIITINYNNAPGLKKTIDSVINQDYDDYEYIVIDGNSSDHSKDIIQSFSDKIHYWVSEPDNGIYHAMNKGIRIAQGEYIHFLNSGDYYASNDVLSFVFSKEYKVPFIRGIQICDYGDRRVRWTNLGNHEVTLYDMYVNTLLHQATFIRRDMFGKYGFYDENLKIVSDWKFFFKAILGGERTVFTEKEFIVFEMEGISTNKLYGERHFEERHQIIRELMPDNIIQDYERLRKLEKDSYIPELIKSNKFYMCIFRVVNKLHKSFK